MFVTSNDLLNLVIAICVVWLTVFLCWALYYTAMILKKINDTLEKISTTLSLVDQFINSVKTKVDSFGQTIATVVKIVNDLTDKAKSKKTNNKKTK